MVINIPTIQPFTYQASTAFQERVQLANKLNEVINALNQIGDIEDLQTQIDTINSTITQIQADIANNDTEISGIHSQVNTLIQEVNGLLSEVVNEVVVDSPGYGQVRVKVIHEDESETASNALQIPVIQDGGITLISGTTDRSFKIQYITMDGVTHTTNDFVIPEGGGTDVTITSISILQGDTANDIKFQVGLSDGSTIQSNSYPIPQAAITPATTSQIGGVKIGANVKVQADGTISVDLTPYALKTEIPDVSQFVTKSEASTTYATKTEVTAVDTKVDSIGVTSEANNVTVNGSNATIVKSVSGQVTDGNLKITVNGVESGDIPLPDTVLPIINITGPNSNSYIKFNTVTVTFETSYTDHCLQYTSENINSNGYLAGSKAKSLIHSLVSPDLNTSSINISSILRPSYSRTDGYFNISLTKLQFTISLENGNYRMPIDAIGGAGVPQSASFFRKLAYIDDYDNEYITFTVDNNVATITGTTSFSVPCEKFATNTNNLSSVNNLLIMFDRIEKMN